LTGREQRLANVAAIAARQRAQTHCARGHEFTGANTIIDGNDNRHCRTCHSDADFYRKTAKARMLVQDPDNDLHGTAQGYNFGCRCTRCSYAASAHRSFTKAFHSSPVYLEAREVFRAGVA
jgi:hypothetical protein